MIRSTIRSAVRSAIRGTVRSDVILPEWTPIFDGLTTYGELYNAWQPSGNNWEVEVEGYSDGAVPLASDQTYLAWSDKANSAEFQRVTWLTDGTELTVNAGTNTGSQFYGSETESHQFSIRYDSNQLPTDFSVYNTTAIGALIRTSTDRFHKGQIQRIKLLDNYDTGRTEYPVNGRDVVELDGLTQYGEIPEVELEVGDVVEFDFIAVPAGGVIRSMLNGTLRVHRQANDKLFTTGQAAIKVDDATVYSEDPLPVDNRVHKMKLTLTTNATLTGMSAENTSATPNRFGNSTIANLRINGNNINRYYPLDRADIIQDVNGNGSTDGDWVNAPTEVFRPNSSIDINTVKRSKDAPLASDNKLVNKLDGQEVGELVNLTGYELVNKGE